ncbi:hypothetical protein ACMFMG_009006 [Clarireedia jacksonii]
MYSAVTNGLGGGGNEGAFQPTTINPQALNQGALPSPATGISSNETPRGIKRSRSPDTYGELPTGENLADDGDSKPRKRGRPMKTRPAGADTAKQPSMPYPVQGVTPQTPQSQHTALPNQTSIITPTQASPPKPTPTKSVIKALPTVRDHTTDQLGPEGDEYIPREYDEAGEKKVTATGQLLDGREYKCRTFYVPNRADKLFMLATECARVLGYRDSYLLFNKNRSLYKIIATQAEKEDLIHQEILPFSYRSRQIAIVTARSMFRQFGSRVIVDGRRVRDDYWEAKARKQGFTEEDMAGEKRPGAAKARDAAAAAEASASANIALAQHGEIVYSNSPGHYSLHAQPQNVPQGVIGMPIQHPLPMITTLPADQPLRDYSNIQRPRQELAGQPYQDRTQPSQPSDISALAQHTAEFNKQLNQQRNRSHDYLERRWRQSQDGPQNNMPIGTSDGLPATQALQSPRASQSNAQQSSMAHQAPQHMLNVQPYSQATHQPSTISQPPIRAASSGSMRPEQMPGRSPSLSGAASTTMSQNAPMYQYAGQNQMWSSNQPQQSPQQHGFSNYGSNPNQQSPHLQQSPHQPSPQVRHSSSNPQMQPTLQYPGMPSMGQGYPASGAGMYRGDQGSPQFMQPVTSGPQPGAQGWAPQQSPGPNASWGWTGQPQ